MQLIDAITEVTEVHFQKFEKIPVTLCADAEAGAKKIAREIARLIKRKSNKGETTVLGLATGSSPIKVYEHLIHMHQKEGLSFDQVVTFNLDEYFPMRAEEIQSYVRFMDEHLFNHVDIRRENIHIPDGSIHQSEVKAFCEKYENKIASYGGIDIQLLGIGRSGHIGFNEPGSTSDSKTRLIRLDRTTRLDAASDFYGEEFVPPLAITMGVGSILSARRVILMAWGEGKARIVKSAVEGPETDSVPATFLQNHPNCLFVLDSAAAGELTRSKTPWLTGNVNWFDGSLIKKAVIWLSQTVDKSVLRLTNEDYNENGLGDLVATYQSAERINLRIFNELQHTITGWPGGKPKVDDVNRPERANPFPKRALIFSPHPDDDVISMGGTLIRLIDQGHDVHVAYQTSGNIAVFDEDVLPFLEFTSEIVSENSDLRAIRNVSQEIKSYVTSKEVGDRDSLMLRRLKGIIRKTEAIAACRYAGVKEENLHFLNLPFYETGTIKKNPIGEEDISIIKELLQRLKPHQIFAAGDLSDPHGTHRVCLQAIYASLERIKTEKQDWLTDTYLWLYRGAWQEWGVEEIDMAVPIGPKDMMRKKRAIFKHQSQKDVAMFPGSDKREFWQRAEDRNQDTARKYHNLGLADYEAMEAFVRKEI